MHLDNGNYKLTLPLSTGQRVFSLREHANVDTFIADVKAEDASIKSVQVKDKYGKVSPTMPVQVLLGGDWTVEIDGRPTMVKSPPRAAIGGKYVSLHPEMAKPSRERDLLKNFLAEEGKTKAEIALKDVIHFAEDKGISEKETEAYLHTLHRLGVVVFLPHNLELQDRVLLHPHSVAQTIEKALALPKLRETTKKSLQAQLEILKERAAILQPEYEIIDAKASRGANLIAYSTLGGLVFQWLLFARFTWWDFSWDVMEPVTYFTMTAELSIFGYLYYLFHDNEYANTDIWTTLYNWRFRRIAAKRKFSIEEWNAVNDAIRATRKEISHHN